MSSEREIDPLLSPSLLKQFDYIGSTHAHKRFPRGQPIRKSVTSHRRSESSIGTSESSIVLMSQRLPLYAERTMHLYLPRLTFDHSTSHTDSSLKTKRTNCSYVVNNKNYLRRKGINLNDLYSLKHNKRGSMESKSQSENVTSTKTQFLGLPLPTCLNTVNHTMSVPLDISGLPHSNGPRQTVTGSPMYTRLIRGLEREAKIPGHVRAEDCSANSLGKVLTKEHLDDLLREEKTVIPAAFYMKSY